MPYRRDARLSGRHPFELFSLVLGLATGLPITIGVAPEPGTINEVLPDVLAYAWACTLTVGSLVALAGVFWKDRGLGLILEQLGLAFVGLMCLVYGGAAVYVVGETAYFPAGLVASFGAACLWRYRQLQGIINNAQAQADSGGH